MTLPLYVTWILDTKLDNDPHAVSPPQPITDFTGWFVHDEFQLLGWTSPDLDGQYTECADGDWLEEPKMPPTQPLFPLNSSGELRLIDVHGGIVTASTLYLLRVDFEAEPTVGIFVVFGWAEPKTRHDDALGYEVNLAPGDTWTRVTFVDGSPQQCLVDIRIVEWVSTDFGGVSRREVDASDLSVFAAYFGQGNVPVRWGWETGESPTNSPNFEANVSPFGDSADYLDWSDLIHMYQDLGKSCGLSKVGRHDDPMTIMRWFGFAPTDETVVWGPNGETGTKFVVADPEQMTRAILDPYGYRDQAAATSVVPWGRVKEFYR